MEKVVYGLAIFGFILIGIGAIGDFLSAIVCNSFIEYRGKSCNYSIISISGALIVAFCSIVLLVIERPNL